MATFNKVTFQNASPKGQGDLRLKSIPAKAGHFNDLIDSLEGGNNTYAGNNTFTGIATHTNGDGKYINGLNTVVKSVSFTGSPPLINSGPVYVPANSLFLRGTVVATTALAFASATVGVSFGTAVGGTQFTGTLNVDSYIASATAIALGVGNSTDELLDTALGGATHLATTVGAKDIAAAAAIHGQVKASTGAFTAGRVAFIIEFLYLGGN